MPPAMMTAYVCASWAMGVSVGVVKGRTTQGTSDTFLGGFGRGAARQTQGKQGQAKSNSFLVHGREVSLYLRPMGLFFHIGRYASFMRSVLRRPEQGAVFRKLLVEEMNAIGLQSLGIVALLSVFMGRSFAFRPHTKSADGSPSTRLDSRSARP